MTTKIKEKIEELKDLISEQIGDNVTSVRIVITHQGVEFNFTQRGAKNLKSDSISMRNISGNWIL